MKPIQIGRQRFSKIFWDIVDEQVSDYPYENIERMIENQQKLRKDADYNTGSLPYDDAVELYKLVKFFQPDYIAEVGTFIGVSTMVMHMADDCIDISTCDMSNNIPHIFKGMENTITYYPKQSSTQMFKDLAEKDMKVDLVYLDGRLQQEDFEPLNKIIHDQTVFVFDDFEGIEKGVVNAMMLEGPSRLLIYPREGKKTAASIPITLLKLTPQEPV